MNALFANDCDTPIAKKGVQQSNNGRGKIGIVVVRLRSANLKKKNHELYIFCDKCIS